MKWHEQIVLVKHTYIQLNECDSNNKDCILNWGMRSI